MKRAFILAGGKGQRLQPYTFVIPKPLMPIGEKPIIGILLARLAKYGFDEVVISVGHMSELLMSVVQALKLPMPISFVHEMSPLGTAGSLSLCDRFDDDLVVMNGDLLTTLNLDALYIFHRAKQATATLGIFRREVKIDFGVIAMDAEERFRGYTEKPTYHFDVSMGINVFHPRVKQYLKSGEYLDIPTLVQRLFDNGEPVVCYREDCKWLDIGREYDYRLATEEFNAHQVEYL